MSKRVRKRRLVAVPSAALPPTRIAPQAWAPTLRVCRHCGCHDDDCSACIERTGLPCHWVEADLCSACQPQFHVRLLALRLLLPALTPGEWSALNSHDAVDLVATRFEDDDQRRMVASDMLPPDARFCVLARSVMSELLAHYDFNLAELADLRKAKQTSGTFLNEGKP